MRNLLIWLSLLFSTACFAEEITVDSVVFDHSFDTAAYKNHGVVGHFSLPKFTVENPARSFVLDSINKHLSQEFPFNDREKFLSLFHDASFSYVIRDGYLLIRMFYVKHYYEGKDMFSCPFVFDLKTGVMCDMYKKFVQAREDSITYQSEEFSVATLKFNDGTIGFLDYSIPKVKTDNPKFLPIVDSVNAKIWSGFSFEENCDWNEFSDWCKGVQYSCEIKDGYLKMDLKYLGKGCSYGDVTNTEVRLIDLKQREGDSVSLKLFTDFQTDTICKLGHFGVVSTEFEYPVRIPENSIEARFSAGVIYETFQLPKVITDNPAYSAISDSINNTLYSEISYSGNLDEFTSHCGRLVVPSCQMGNGYLLIDLGYADVRLKDNWEKQFLFDLKTGKPVTYGDKGEHAFPPFSALFTTDGYFEFLNSRKWSDEVKKNHFDHAPSVQFDIDYRIDGDLSYKIGPWEFSLDYTCEDDYYWYTNQQGNECWYEGKDSWGECRKEEVLPYLNQVGRALFDARKSPIERILKAHSYCGKVGHNLFLQLEYQEGDDNPGVVYRDSSLQVAVDISKPKRVKGYLYVNGKRERIKGSFEDDELHLKSRESNWRCSLSHDGASDVWSGLNGYEVMGCSDGTKKTFYYDETD